MININYEKKTDDNDKNLRRRALCICVCAVRDEISVAPPIQLAD